MKKLSLALLIMGALSLQNPCVAFFQATQTGVSSNYESSLSIKKERVKKLLSATGKGVALGGLAFCAWQTGNIAKKALQILNWTPYLFREDYDTQNAIRAAGDDLKNKAKFNLVNSAIIFGMIGYCSTKLVQSLKAQYKDATAQNVTTKARS